MDTIGFVAVIFFLLIVLIIIRNTHDIFSPISSRDADGYVHMIIAREFRKNNHRVPDTISANMFDWTFSYPFLLHFLLSFFPEKSYEIIDRIFPTLLDLLYVALLLLLLPLGLITPDQFPIILGLFVITPQFIQYAGGKGLSARKPGILLGTLSFLSFYLWLINGRSLFLLGSLLLAALTHLTSRFGTQAVVFIYLGFALTDLTAILMIPGSLLAAILLSAGAYIAVFRSHLLFWHYFATHRQFVDLYNGFKSLDTVRRFLYARSARDLLSALDRSVLLKASLNNPYALLGAAIVGFSLWSPAYTVSYELTVWFSAGFAAYILTSLYGFRFLGQPGRYLNFVFIPGVLLVLDYYYTAPPDIRQAILLVLAIGPITIVGQALKYRLTSSPGQQESFDKTIEFLSLQAPCDIVVQPRYLGAEIAWKVPDVRVTDYFGGGHCSREAEAVALEIFENEPFVTSDVETLSNLVKPDWVFFNTDSISAVSEPGLRPPDGEPVFKSGPYEVYEWVCLVESSASDSIGRN